MPSGRRCWSSFFGLGLVLAVAASPAIAAEPVDYLRQIKPILAARCYACHGGLQQHAGLRLDTAAAARQGGDSGAAVIPGQPAASTLLERVQSPDPDARMPPESDGRPLTADEIALLAQWIAQGADGPAEEQPEADPRQHWSFQPPRRPAVPAAPAAWVRNPIDAFIAAEHQRRGVQPQGEADRRTLLRRLTIDLTGLPPTREEQAAFLQDTSPDAYERVVDRLLESPQYGERWGRHFMDVWRYSDWWGLGAEVRNSQKHIWHWRDWIVESLNQDVGYDEMLRQMLAADELYPTEPAKLRATGYLARQYFKFNRNTWMEETIEHTSKAFLGLTLNCTRCHDHKYDPFEQKEYYQFRAFFEPYQIRTDQAPGEADYERNGIPRAFDCNLEAPTYRFSRGDEKRPVKDEPISPGVPRLLAFAPVEIVPVTLPDVAVEPGLQPWVVQNYLSAAQSKIEQAAAETAKAKATLAEVEKRVAAAAAKPAEPMPATPADPAVLLDESFTVSAPERWKAASGDWQFAAGNVVQKKLGAMRSALEWQGTPPADFSVQTDFTIHKGEQWKSTGLAFDIANGWEVIVYLSAYADGPKAQIAWGLNGNFEYPPAGTAARPIKLDEKQQLTVQVRGALINVALGEQTILAMRLPHARRAGKFALITFDAESTFSRCLIKSLGPDVKLVDAAPPATTPGTAPPDNPEVAKAAVVRAEALLAAARLQPAVIEARALADRARRAALADPAPALQQHQTEAARAAARLERHAAALQAEAAWAQAAFDLANAPLAQQEPLQKKIADAQAAVEKARAAIDGDGENYTPLSGSLKTLENNLENEASRSKPFPTTSTGRRTALARWITARENPLAARVAVNHVWNRHFGQPLVPTLFDFGRKGTPPTHPELLDWLAVELMDQGWSLKHLHRLIVTSATYRLSGGTRGSDSKLAADAENESFWRRSPQRIEAQVIRDGMLHLAGALDRTFGGPSIPVTDTASRRRSLYFVHSHNEHQRFLSMFDDASVQECYRREQSIVPQQALALSNSQLALEMAQQIAQRLHAEAALADDSAFVQAVFVTVLAAEPTPEESQTAVEALSQLASARQDLPADVARLRARQSLVHALLNHNDFVTLR